MAPRRVNRSKKVPNVILRPADPAAISRISSELAETQSLWAANDDSDSGKEASPADRCPRPFRGVVLCATGIRDKTTIFKHAIELGAQSYDDLTDRVTHIIATEPGSAKYKFALENRIPIMHPSWITESYEIWLKGDDVDLQESIEIHRLPVFAGVVLTLSGFEDVTERTQVNRLITQHGGVYVKNIERPVKVTHLLCSSKNNEITEKMRYAEKFNSRRESNICLVWEEWLWDSLEFGGRFDENKYKVTNPPPQRKVLLETASPPLRSSSPPDADSDNPNLRLGPHRSKTVISGGLGDDEEEIASVKRVPAVTLQIWGTMLKPYGFAVTNGKLVRSPSKSQAMWDGNRDQGDVAMLESSPTRRLSRAQSSMVLPVERGGITKGMPASALSSFRRAKSFAPMKPAEAPRQPFQRILSARAGSPYIVNEGGPSRGRAAPLAPASSFMLANSSRSVTGDGASEPSASTSTSAAAPNLFARLKFRVLGEAKSASVRSAIEESGGEMVADDSDQVDYIIVRLVSGSKFYHDEFDDNERRKYRTECWLERCIFQEQICLPDEHVAFTPLKATTPIADTEQISLSFSGLDQSEACWVRRLLRALGVSLAPNFSRRSTHLLCPSKSGAKFEKALEWGIPVLDMTWLAEMATTGVVPSTTSTSATASSMDVDVDDVIPPRAASVMQDIKGKGREVDVSHRMSDITNGIALSNQSHPNKPGSGPQPFVSNGSGQDEDSFGQVNGLLRASRQPSLDSTPPPNSHDPTPDVVLHAEPKAGSAVDCEDVIPPPSTAEIRHDKSVTQIPSSKSPSPMKIPSRTRTPGTSNPPSPIKISLAATKALEESITRLLGKRPSEEDEEIGAHTRLGKRPRPPISRVKSHPKVVARQEESSASPLEEYSVCSQDISLLAGSGHLSNENMRVTYEDPAQRAEKKRLMTLLNGQKTEVWDSQADPAGGTSAKKGRGPTRRSSRVAGF